jgi:hypothetical protein
MDTVESRAVGATEELFTRFQAVTNDPALAMRA